MSYERFIKKDGKIYGPYTYQSKRVGGKIVSSYVKTRRTDKNLFFSILIMFSLFVLLCSGMYFINTSTGRVTLQISQDSLGVISGNLSLFLKNGELIPVNSVVRVSLNGEVKDFLLSDLVNSSVSNGSFYAENSELSGFGEGFGFVGEKTSYPDVYFSLFFTDDSLNNSFENLTNISVINQTNEEGIIVNESRAVLGGGSGILESDNSSVEIVGPINSSSAIETIENSSSNSESSSSNPESGLVENPVAETPIINSPIVEIPAVETPVIESSVETPSSETQTSSNDAGSSESSVVSSGSSSSEGSSGGDSSGSPSSFEASGDGGSSGITGNVISDLSSGEREVLGKVNKKSSFAYPLNGRNFLLDNIYSDFENLSSSDLIVKEENGEVVVTTDYNKSEVGFGEDFLSNNLNELNIPVCDFGLSGNGTLKIEIISNGKTVAKISKEIGKNISLENKTNVSLEILANIGEVEVAKNSSYGLDLDNYFSAENYSIDNVKNISLTIDGNVLKIVPDENFVGARSVVVFAYVGNESISQKFIIKVLNSSNIITKQFRAVINQPVRWVKSIDVGNESNISLEIPKEADNISIKTGEDAVQALNEVVVDNSVVEAGVGITGNVVSFSPNEGIFTKLFNLFRLTGRVIGENLNENIIETDTKKIIDVSQISQDANVSQISIEYQTPAPLVNETDYSNGKSVVVYSEGEFNYTNILAYIQLNNEVSLVNKNKINLIWHASYQDALKYGYVVENNSDVLISNASLDEVVVNSEIINDSEINSEYLGSGLFTGKVVVEVDTINNVENNVENNNSGGLDYLDVPINFEAYDLDGDDNIDYIEWNVPHLSAQSYNLTINSADLAVNTINEGNVWTHLAIDTTKAPYNNLVAYYPFDFGNSTWTYDYSGSNYDGSFMGTFGLANTSSSFGNSFNVTGAGCVNMSNKVGLNIGVNNMTFSVWAKANVANVVNSAIFAKSLYGGAANRYYLASDASGYIVFGLTDNGNVINITQSSTKFDTSWHNYIVVLTRNGNCTLYRDNVSIASLNVSNSATQNISSTFAFEVGAYNDAAGNAGYANLPFNGSIDELMIFNTTLNSTQISDIYANQSARFYSSGLESLKSFIINSSQDKINISLDNYQRNRNTNISLRVGAWDSSLGYNNTDINGNNGLVSYWHLDSNNGTLTYSPDSIGTNNGSCVGMGSACNFTSGYYNNSLAFNGSGTYFNVASASSLNSSSSISISVWVKTINSVGAIVTKIDPSQSAKGYYFGLYSSLKPTLYVRNSTGNGWAASPQATAIPTNTWTHLIMIIDGVNNRTYIYENGLLDQNVSLVGGWDYGISYPLRVGYRFEGFDNNQFNGSIDEVMFFNRTLTNSDIQELYNKGRAKWNYSAYQNITGNSTDTHSTNQFAISTNTTNILSELGLQSDSKLFYSPVVTTTASLPMNLTTLDTIKPVVSILYPSSVLYFNTTSIPLNFSVLDADSNLNCWWTNNSGATNNTIVGCINTTINVALGTSVITLYANDSSGNIGNASVVIFSGLTLPFGVNLLNNSYGTFSAINATSNYNYPNYNIRNTVDNSLTSSNAYNNGWLSAVNNNVNVTINLTNSYDFNTVEVFDADWYTGGGHLSASPKDTNLWVSDDYSSWTKVANKTLFGSAPTNKGQYDYLSFTKQTKKYIKLEFLNNWGDSTFIGTSEIRAYYNSSDLPNLSATTITATNSASGYPATYLSDNLFATDDNDWRTNNGVTSANLTWNFSTIKRFNSLEFTGHSNANFNYYPKDYVLLVSSDGTTFSPIYSGTFVGGLECKVERLSFPEQKSQYFRLQINNAYNTIIIGKEIRIFEQNDVNPPVLNISYPLNNSNFNYTTSIPLNFSVLDADSNLNCWWTNNSGATNNTIIGCNNTFINLSSGLTSLILYSNDSSGNLGSSLINIVADSVYPAITFIYPAQSGNQSQNYSYVNISSSDNAGDHFVVNNFDSSLLSWYRMDDLNSSGNVVDYLGRNNLTSFFSGASQTDVGKFGKGFGFNGVLAGLQSSSINSSLYNTSSFSLCSWVYLKNNSANNTLFYWGHASVSPYTYFVFGLDSSSNLRFVFNNGTSKTITGSRINVNSWAHVCMVLNSSYVVFYINGSVGTPTAVSNAVSSRSDSWDKTIMGSSAVNATLNGSIDEVMIFNRSISSSEILALYNASVNKYYNNFTGLAGGGHAMTAYVGDLGGNINSSSRTINIDSVVPAASLSKNASQIEFNSGAINLIWSASDSNLQAVIFNVTYPNSSLAYSSTSSSGNINLNPANLTALGIYSVSLFVNDSAGNINLTSTTFSVNDTIAPLVGFVAPTNNSGVTLNQNWFFVNVTASDSGSGLKNITFSLYDSNNNSINITSFSSSPASINYTNLNNGVYYYNVTAYDNSGKLNYTETRSIIIQNSQAIAIDFSSALNQQVSWNLVYLPAINLSASGDNNGGLTDYYVNYTTDWGLIDLYMKASGNLVDAGGDILGLGNESYNLNLTDRSVPGLVKIPLTTNYADNKIADSVSSGAVYLKFYLSAPSAQPAGVYNNTIMIKAVPHGQAP